MLCSEKNVKITVSVLLLSYNHGDYIERAVKSVFEQGQYLDYIELLVIDDGSTDSTKQKLESLQKEAPISMKVFYNQHEGVAAIPKNLLKLIKESSGNYISFLASDDFYTSNRFEAQLEYFSMHPKCQIVYANGIDILCEEEVRFVVTPIDRVQLESGNPQGVLDYMLQGAPQIYLQTVLAKSDFIKKCQPFDVDLIADDWIFNIKVFQALIASSTTYGFIDIAVFKRNLLHSSTSNNRYQHFNRVAGVAERYINPKNYKFYIKFYGGYIKAFYKIGDYCSMSKLVYRSILLFLGAKTHVKGLTRIIKLG